MNEDIKRVGRFALNQNIIVPRDEEDLPLSVDDDDEIIYWIAFESPEIGQQSPALNPQEFNWGQISGLQYLKFLHERIEAGGEHALIINPGTPHQIGLENQSVKGFLEWLDRNPTGLNSL